MMNMLGTHSDLDWNKVRTHWEQQKSNIPTLPKKKRTWPNEHTGNQISPISLLLMTFLLITITWVMPKDIGIAKAGSSKDKR
jgi:hypothetical protein